MPRLRTHPGEVLAVEYMKPLSLGASALARAIGVPGSRISDIVRQRRDVSADTAIRLGRFFDVDPRFWLNLQTAYDLSRAETDNDYSAIRPVRAQRHSADHAINAGDDGQAERPELRQCRKAQRRGSRA